MWIQEFTIAIRKHKYTLYMRKVKEKCLVKKINFQLFFHPRLLCLWTFSLSIQHLNSSSPNVVTGTVIASDDELLQPYSLSVFVINGSLLNLCSTSEGSVVNVIQNKACAALGDYLWSSVLSKRNGQRVREMSEGSLHEILPKSLEWLSCHANL